MMSKGGVKNMSKYVLPHLYVFFGYVIYLLSAFLAFGSMEAFSYHLSRLLILIGLIWIIVLIIKDIRKSIEKRN